MKLEVWEQDIRDDSFAEGKAEGRAEGIAEGKVEGIAEGEMLRFISQVCRKMTAGKTPEEIAQDLGEEPEEVKRVYDVAIKELPSPDAERVLRKLKESDRVVRK